MDLTTYLSNLDWRLLLLMGGVVFVIMMILINFFWGKTPSYVRELTSYMNLKDFDGISNILQYSKYFKRHNNVRWLFVFNGKREGKELFFGSYILQNNRYNFFLIKEEVKPMMVTDENDDYDWPYSLKDKIAGREFNFYAQDKYLIENITNSDDLRIIMEDLLGGDHNCLEFTDLNQVLLVTDHEFKDGKELIEYFIKIFKLKDKI